jgi:hypothetical protein
MYTIRENELLTDDAPMLSVERPIFLHTKSRFFHSVTTQFAIIALTRTRIDRKRGKRGDQGS